MAKCCFSYKKSIISKEKMISSITGMIFGGKSVFSKHQLGGGTVMFSGSFAANRTIAISCPKIKTDSEACQDILVKNLFPDDPLLTSRGHIFQHNVSIRI